VLCWHWDCVLYRQHSLTQSFELFLHQPLAVTCTSMYRWYYYVTSVRPLCQTLCVCIWVYYECPYLCFTLFPSSETIITPPFSHPTSFAELKYAVEFSTFSKNAHTCLVSENCSKLPPPSIPYRDDLNATFERPYRFHARKAVLAAPPIGSLRKKDVAKVPQGRIQGVSRVSGHTTFWLRCPFWKLQCQ